MMFAIRKIFIGTLCALLGVMPVFADSDNFIDAYVGYMSGFYKVDVTEETAGDSANKYHAQVSELPGGQMLPETQRFVMALCNRMQKYIRANNLNISVSVDACGVSNKNALDIDCGSTDSCMVLIVPQMAKAIEGKE